MISVQMFFPAFVKQSAYFTMLSAEFFEITHGFGSGGCHMDHQEGVTSYRRDREDFNRRVRLWSRCAQISLNCVLLLRRGKTGSAAWVGTTNRSEKMKDKLHDRKLTSHIHCKG